jgi:carbonic anhydrase
MEYVDATNTAITYDCYVKMNSVQSVWDDENFKPASGGLSGRKIAQNGVNEQVDGNFGSFYDYKVKQFNFHSPSEHTIDGTAYDAEMHIVFEQDADHLVVFAILFSSNETDNTWLESIKFSNAPNMSGPAADRRPVDIPGNIEPFSKFQSILDGGYYHYAGSMTTPPCSEIVSWFVFDTPAQIGAAQLTYFKSIFADPMNNRPVQALNGRKVVYGSYEKGTQQTGEEAVFLELAAPSLIEQYKQTHKDIYHRKCMPCPYTGDQKTWVGDGRHDAKKYMCVEEPEMVHGKAVISTGWRSCFAAGSDRCQDSCEGFIKSADPDDPFGDIETSIECGTEIKTTDSGYCICDKTKKVGAYPAVPKPYLNCNEACDTDHFAYWRQTSDCKWDGARDIMNDKKGDTEIDHRFGGYCECEDRTKGGHLESTNIKVMKANCDPKTHPYATCTEACEALWAGTLITIH